MSIAPRSVARRATPGVAPSGSTDQAAPPPQRPNGPTQRNDADTRSVSLPLLGLCALCVLCKNPFPPRRRSAALQLCVWSGVVTVASPTAQTSPPPSPVRPVRLSFSLTFRTYCVSIQHQGGRSIHFRPGAIHASTIRHHLSRSIARRHRTPRTSPRPLPQLPRTPVRVSLSLSPPPYLQEPP